jgi:hypothetical protein
MIDAWAVASISLVITGKVVSMIPIMKARGTPVVRAENTTMENTTAQRR